MIFDNSFLHFFDSTFVEERLNRIHRMALKEMESALIMSFLFSKRSLIPLTSFIESPFCKVILEKYRPLFNFGIICFVGGDTTLSEYIESKMSQYPKGTNLGKTYRQFSMKKHILPYKEKKGSSTQHIRNEWHSKLKDFDEIIRIFNPYFSQKKIDKLSKSWEMIPEKLNGKAFIVSHVIPLLDKSIDRNINVKNHLHRIINHAYFNHYIQTLESAVITDLVYLDSEEVNSLAINAISYRTIMEILLGNPSKYKHLLNHEVDSIIQNRQSELINEIYYDSLLRKRKQSEILINLHKTNAMIITNETTIGIITALPVEFTAMRLMLIDEKDPPKIIEDPNDYKMGYIKTQRGENVKIILAMAKEIGTNQAANVTTNLIRSYPEVKQIIMVGIAGGTPNIEKPEEHVRLGDIVVIDNEGLIQYDNLKIDSKTIKIRDKSAKPSALFIGRTRMALSEIFLGKELWLDYISEASKRVHNGLRPDASSDILRINGENVEHPLVAGRNPDLPKVHIGKIGCSNTLLKNENIRNILRDEHGVKAIEMESSGVADGTWSCSKDYFVVRGIVDYCNDDKSDKWHQYSAISAAAFTKWLIESI